MSPPREAYVRVWMTRDNLELSLGLEYETEEEVEELQEWVKTVADWSLNHVYKGPMVVVSWAERLLRGTYPGRAYFIETERESSGVQVFQPFGLPRTRGSSVC